MIMQEKLKSLYHSFIKNKCEIFNGISLLVLFKQILTLSATFFYF